MYWKEWAAKHEHEELKEGVWLEPELALLRKKVKENRTEKHRNVPGKIVLEGGWTQEGYSILDGRMSVSVKLARLRKVQKSKGSTTVRNGTQ